MGLRDAELDWLRRLHPTGPGERFAALASTLTKHGALWFALTALLHRSARMRRAGYAGLAGWAVAAAPSFLVKSATDRPRSEVPWQAGPSPSSSSMPSSHTAGAVAYATAATLAEPSAAPVWILAALVGWSRLATGRHFPTDVAAGAAIGAISGVAVHRVARRSPS